jgi:spore coat polysaccharide biosynthesis protein SpsF
VTAETGIVLQARLASTRLPGKALAQVGSYSILEHSVRRLAVSGFPIVVATTDRPEDDVLVKAARRLDVEVYRGSELDVLARYVGAARTFGFSEVIRATADNPFVDAEAPRRTSIFRRRVAADHAVECGLPIGAAVEAVSTEALERAMALAVDPYDREHVTSLLRRDARFRALRAIGPGHLRRPSLRLTVDTAEDLAFVREVLAATEPSDRMPDLATVIAAADRLLVRDIAQKRMKQGA